MPEQPQPGAAPSADLALYRPVAVSSTDYAATQAEFAVDGLTSTGVRGSGWRAADGVPQWISVDLQADCRVESVRLTFEATADDPVFVPADGGNPRGGTTGQEILSSCAVDFTVETSRDGRSWTTVHSTDSGTGGVVEIGLAAPLVARWVRMTVRRLSTANPLGLNGFEVYGTPLEPRPSATGWTDWGTRDHEAPELLVAADGTVPLESGWTLTMDDRAGGQGADLSRPGVDTSRWLPATVPGTVLTSLVDQGRLPDPVAGFGNLHIPEALSRHSWWYRRGFRLPVELRAGPGRHIWLEFDGVNHTADIWLNGRRTGTLTYPFARAAHDVTELLAAGGEQVLAVKITPMPFPGSPADKGPAGRSWVDAGADMMNRNSPTYLASSGWDWMPAVRDRAAGIWNHVRLRSTGDAVIGDPRVDTTLPDLPDTRTAEVTIVVPVRNAGTSDRRMTVSAAFGDVQLSQTVALPAGATADVAFTPAAYGRLRLRDPELWWPNGYGEPVLHDLTVVAAVDGVESDRRTTRFGIRQFGYEYEPPSSGGGTVPLKISVNGVRVFCRGGNWGWDELLRRMPPERMDAAVRMHRDMNFTMIRNWVGSSTREEFYAACDEHGLLVWNDFPNAWAMDPPDHQAFLDLARDTVRRYRIHPSVAVWCGANEGDPPGPVDKGMREAVEGEAPAALYQSNSAGGVVSGGGPYGWIEPDRYHSPSTYGGVFGFHTEIGMPVVPTAESMRSLVGGGPEWPIGGPWYHHDWSAKGNQATLDYQAAIEVRLGAASGLDDFTRKAQFVNYENFRAMFEAWNAHLWRDASGLMLWMSHPAWHSTVWQTYDYDFDVNGAYFGARKACEPVHVQADPQEWRVVAVNHTPRALTGVTVTAAAFDLAGRPLGASRRTRVDVPPSATERAFTAGWAPGMPDLHLLRLTLEDAEGRVLSENVYWRYREAAHMRALNDVPQAQVSARAAREATTGTRRSLTATVTNDGPVVAAMVRLSLLDDRTGGRVLPTLYGDNYLWLLPGESRAVTLSWPAEALPSDRPALRVEGYNVPRTVTRP
ncbi:glycosyl hydrolase 2 galactose-binding domain-containing protein [Planotetraspora kaengkrachanensis]|uniref:F5/8 type C domain-containing protein n=1 Tax=Planotetraspora kaengkrachanensis TaxID=575193 RepID=A0A8J3M574_9ACTN|nr:hypothetical protein [Planotetraspora kaengkrachanensis]GIG79480.1 hypothetical protein Pka01_26070 [Planotetraspora kaengkrachanensis]